MLTGILFEFKCIDDTGLRINMIAFQIIETGLYGRRDVSSTSVCANLESH